MSQHSLKPVGRISAMGEATQKIRADHNGARSLQPGDAVGRGKGVGFIADAKFHVGPIFREGPHLFLQPLRNARVIACSKKMMGSET